MEGKTRVQIGINPKLAVQLDEVGFAEKLKTRPKAIKFLIDFYNSRNEVVNWIGVSLLINQGIVMEVQEQY